MSAADLLLALAALPALCASGYLFYLTLFSRRSPAPRYGAPAVRYEFVIPAYNEELGIAATVASLRAVDYPRELFAVTVVADNCTDQTAALAQAAGARVLVREDRKKRGKGYALAFAFARILSEGVANALVVVDADTLVSANLLQAFSARLDCGAQAVQADYAVRNPFDSWRTRLITIALGSFHVLRSLARERLQLSCGLRGNGMCFTSALLKEVPHDAVSLVEDLEYGILLGEAGHRVHYAAEAHVYGTMVAQANAAVSQRRRWEGGRLALAKRRGLTLLARALRERNALLFDLALDLLVPPLTWIILLVAAGLTAAALLAIAGGTAKLSLLTWSASGFFAAAYVLRGWALTGTGPRGLLDLFCSPLYVIWKVVLLLKRSERPRDEWIRTARQREELWDRPEQRGSPRK